MGRKELFHNYVDADRELHRNRFRCNMQLDNSYNLQRGQFPFILCIYNGVADTVTGLAKALHISAAAAGVSVKRLEKSGYVTRSTDTMDNRVTRVTLTEQGYQAAEAARGFFDKVDEASFKDITDEEIETLCDLTRRMSDNLSSFLNNYIL